MSHIPIAFCVVGALVVLYLTAATWESKELNRRNPTRRHRTADREKSEAVNVEAPAGRWGADTPALEKADKVSRELAHRAQRLCLSMASEFQQQMSAGHLTPQRRDRHIQTTGIVRRSQRPGRVFAVCNAHTGFQDASQGRDQAD
jgi:hypothetical protein